MKKYESCLFSLGLFFFFFSFLAKPEEPCQAHWLQLISIAFLNTKHILFCNRAHDYISFPQLTMASSDWLAPNSQSATRQSTHASRLSTFFYFIFITGYQKHVCKIACKFSSRIFKILGVDLDTIIQDWVEHYILSNDMNDLSTISKSWNHFEFVYACILSCSLWWSQ